MTSFAFVAAVADRVLTTFGLDPLPDWRNGHAATRVASVHHPTGPRLARVVVNGRFDYTH